MNARTIAGVSLLALLVQARDGLGYSLRRSTAGPVLIWRQLEQLVEVDTSLVRDMAGAEDAVRAAMKTWIDAGMPMRVVVTPSNGKRAVAIDGRNVVTWAADTWKYTAEVVAMSVSNYKQNAAVITETDVVLNGRNLRWSVTADGSAFDVQNVLTHEFGHFFGLAHEPQIPAATMYPFTPAGETSKRTLDFDDRAGLASLTDEISTRTPAASPLAGDVMGREAQGCAMAGSLSGSWIVVLPLLVMIVRRQSRGLYALMIVVLADATPARATTVRYLSIPELAATAEVVVQGRVVGQHAHLVDGMVATDHYLVVERGYRGARLSTVTLRTLGGELGDIVTSVEGSPRLRVGDKIVVFGRWQGGTLFPLGLSLGVLQVRGERVVEADPDLHVLDHDRLRPLGTLRLRLEELEPMIDRPRANVLNQ